MRSRPTSSAAGSSSAEEAVAYGILDEVARPDADIRRLPGTGAGQPPMGFRPLR